MLKKVGTCLALVASVSTSTAFATATNVNVVNIPTVNVAGTPAVTIAPTVADRFQTTCSLNLDATNQGPEGMGGTGTSCQILTDSRRIVIESVSAICRQTQGASLLNFQLVTYEKTSPISNAAHQQYFVPVKTGTDAYNSNYEIWIVPTTSTKVYSDLNAAIAIERSALFANTSCVATIQGHFEPSPF